MPDSSKHEESDIAALTARDALEHAWNWFKHHADQPLTMMRFAVLVAGGVAAGIGYLQKDQHFFLCILLSIFGGLASFCFLRLDARTSDLIKVGEGALIALEATLANQIGTPQINICIVAEQKNSKFLYTYRENIRFMLGIVIALYLIVFLYCVKRLIGG